MRPVFGEGLGRFVVEQSTKANAALNEVNVVLKMTYKLLPQTRARFLNAVAIALGMLFLSSVAFSQAPTPPGKIPNVAPASDNNQLFLGFVRTFNDWGSNKYTYDMIGGVASYTRMLNHHWGVLGSFEGNTNGDWDAVYYAYRAGAKYDILTGKYRPYLVGSAGGAHLTGIVTTQLPDGSFRYLSHSWFGFTAGGGGGLDVDVTNHLGGRVEYNAYQVPFGFHQVDRDLWTELSVGFVYRW